MLWIQLLWNKNETFNSPCIGEYNERFWTSGNAEGFWKHDFHWDSTGRLFRQYSNWAAGQPDGENTPGNCIILSHVDGFKWHDVDCKFDNLRYICEKKGIFNRKRN